MFVKLVLFECFFFFFQAEDGIRDRNVTGVQTCALPISASDECRVQSDELNSALCTHHSALFLCPSVVQIAAQSYSRDSSSAAAAGRLSGARTRTRRRKSSRRARRPAALPPPSARRPSAARAPTRSARGSRTPTSRPPASSRP